MRKPIHLAKGGAAIAAIGLAATGWAGAPFGTATASAQSPFRPGVLVVAATGSDSGNCRFAACATLGYALTQASAHETIVIEPGTYTETGGANVVPPSLTGLTITSAASPARTVIDATGNANGLLIEADGVNVRGLTVENANLEGILAEPPKSTWPATPTSPAVNITGLTIAGNVVTHNDLAYNPKLPALSACPSSLTDADDCGEGIHLMGVSWSRVIGNQVTDNVGGILLSDGGFGIAVGPATHNLIADNVSENNSFDCGITLPGHDPFAVATSGPDAGEAQPSVAGVYDNTVIHNIANDNGGAGLLDAAPYAGAASYDNIFADNSASGNGNAGFTLHAHAGDQDVSGIVVVGNRFGTNNLLGDPDTGVTATTGIMLLSVSVPTSVEVADNVVSDDVNGIASNSDITAIGHNFFRDVTDPAATYTPPAA
jgi:hypothetical protein